MQNVAQPSAAGLQAVGFDEQRLPVAPNHRFVLVHPPGSYEFKGGRWLPKVKLHRLMPGVNGVRRGANGWSTYFGRLVSDGYTIIDPLPVGGVLVTGDDDELEETPGYMIPWPARGRGRKGTHYAMVWAIPTVVGRGRTASVQWDFDEAGFDAWRERLMDTGVLPKPKPADVGQQVVVQRKRAERHIKGAHDGAPHVQAKVEAEQGRLVAMETATAALEPVRPKRNTKRKKATTKRPAATGV